MSLAPRSPDWARAPMRTEATPQPSHPPLAIALLVLGAPYFAVCVYQALQAEQAWAEQVPRADYAPGLNASGRARVQGGDLKGIDDTPLEGKTVLLVSQYPSGRWEVSYDDGKVLRILPEYLVPYDECEELSSNGSYLSHTQFMLDHCFATVGTACAAQQPALTDARADPAECARWAATNQCTFNPGFMREQCSASCGRLLLQRYAVSRRIQRLAARLAVPPAWQRDDAAGNCSAVDATTCLRDAELQMERCPASCLALVVPDNASAHSCQQWAQRDECIKDVDFMADECASTCAEQVFREQTRLRLARNTPGGAKHVADAALAAGALLAAALLERLSRGRTSRRARPAVGVPALPCLLVASYFFIEALCSLQARRAYWDWLNPDWRQGKTELAGLDLEAAWNTLVLPAVCVVWLTRRQSSVLAATCVTILAAQLVAVTFVDTSRQQVQALAVATMQAAAAEEGGAGGGVVYTAAQLAQKHEQLMSEGEFVVKRVSLIGSLVAFLAAHATHLSQALNGLPGQAEYSPNRNGGGTPLRPEAVAIGVGRLLIGVPFVVAGYYELRALLFSEQLPFPMDDAHNVLWPKALMLLLCLPLILGLGPFRGLARALAVLCVLEAVVLWSAPAATAVMWHEAAEPNTLSYKEAFHEVLLHRRRFGLLLAVSGGCSMLEQIGAGGYTLGGLLKKRA